jgi:hypothetical protein
MIHRMPPISLGGCRQATSFRATFGAREKVAMEMGLHSPSPCVFSRLAVV